MNKIIICIFTSLLFFASFAFAENNTQSPLVVLPQVISEEQAREFMHELTNDKSLMKQLVINFSDLKGIKGSYKFVLRRNATLRSGFPDIFASSVELTGSDDYPRKNELAKFLSDYLYEKRQQLEFDKKLTGPFFQSSTNIIFPSDTEDFDRISILKYDKQAYKVGAGYFHKKIPLPITIFAYPSVNPIEQTSKNIEAANTTFIKREFEKIIEESKISHEVETTINSNNYPLQINNITYQGLHATIPYEGYFFNTKLAVVMEIFLFQIDQSFFNFRMTYPVDVYQDDLNIKDMTEKFITTFLKEYKK